jgi:hypothetical protein
MWKWKRGNVECKEEEEGRVCMHECRKMECKGRGILHAKVYVDAKMWSIEYVEVERRECGMRGKEEGSGGLHRCRKVECREIGLYMDVYMHIDRDMHG